MWLRRAGERAASRDRADASGLAPGGSPEQHHARHALRLAGSQLRKSALKLVGYLLIAYIVLRLIPGLEQALSSLEHVSWLWVIGALALETVSEMGFVVSWRAIVDPDDVLGREGRGHRMASRAAWAQLGGGTLVPGGSFAGVGVGAWILHRFGMASETIAEREFSLSFLNTAIDGLALVLCGVLLATGIVSGERHLTLTLLPAVLVVIAIAAALVVARRAETCSERLRTRHPRVADALATLAAAVEDTDRLLFHGGSFKSVLGALAYLWFDMLVLWSAFWVVHAHPVPGFAVLVMAYVIGALGGVIPFVPLNLGTIGGMVGMFILYGVGHDAAIAAVLIYQAVGLLVPLVGGGIAYAVLRRDLGPLPDSTTGRSGEHGLAKG